MNLWSKIFCVVLAAFWATSGLAESRSERANLQLKSLSHLLFNDAPKPPKTTRTEINQIKKLVKQSPDSLEVKALKRIYGTRYDIMAYANRDTDNDGVFDFRLRGEYGKFFEGDIDIDGDGVRNIYDISPYDATVGGKDNNGDGIPDEDFADSNSKGIPKHFDSLNTKKSQYADDADTLKRLSEIQLDLFRRHKIILVERTSDFPLSLAESVHTTITKVFRSVFKRSRTLETLRTVSSEDHAWLYPDNGEICAFYFAPSQTLSIFRPSIDTPAIFQIGLLAHEIAHAWQFSLDFDTSALETSYGQYYFPLSSFMKEIAQFGWEEIKNNKVPTYTLFAPFDETLDDSLFYDEAPKAWGDWLSEIYEEVGDDYLEEPRVKEYFIVSDYSMTLPIEWFSDNMIAYVFTILEDAAFELGAETEPLKSKFKEAQYAVWPGFYHGGIRGGPAFDYFSSMFPMTKKDKVELAKQHLLPMVDE